MKLAIALIAALALLIAFAQWRRMAGPSDTRDQVAGLPLREFPARGVTRPTLVIYLTSDAGWIGLNSSLPAALAELGYPTVAWNSLRYYVTPRTREEAAKDLTQLIDHYRREWAVERFALVGYSWGAGVLPFLANTLPAVKQSELGAAVFLAYPGVAAFHFRPTAWLNWLGDDAIPAQPEVAAMRRVPSVCIAGESDPIRDCRSIESLGIERHLYPVGHSLTSILDELLPHIVATLEKGDR